MPSGSRSRSSQSHSESQPQSRKKHANSTALVEHRPETSRSSDVIKFRGGSKSISSNEMETVLEKYNENLLKMNDYVEKECATEIEQLKQAQKSLQKKMKETLSHEEMQTCEKNVQETQTNLSRQMRRMHRELQDLEDNILDDVVMSEDQKMKNLDALHQTAIQEYTRLSQKYPAAMKVQILNNMQHPTRSLTYS